MFVSTFLTLLALSGAVSAWCGASDPSKEGLAIHRELREKEASGLHPRQADGNQIEVYIHVFAHEESDSTIARDVRQQINVLNEVFRTTGFSFILAGADRAVIPDLAPVWYGNEAEAQIKQYRVGGIQTLNFYIVPQVAYSYAGYATFPWDAANNTQVDGVVMGRDYIPGGSASGTNTGKVGGHEAGHWLGLLHTFHNGCDGGDEVDDTPPEASPARGCPWVRDTCPAEGRDPIHNHMDYTNDACRYQWSAGQIERMHNMWTLFRGNDAEDPGTGVDPGSRN